LLLLEQPIKPATAAKSRQAFAAIFAIGFSAA
jgi:hypothetical protein